MSKFVNLFGVALLVMISFIAIGGAASIIGPERYIRWGVFALAAFGIIWLAFCDRRREKGEASQVSAEIEARFLELLAQAGNPAFRLAVRGSSGMIALPVAFILASGAWFVFRDNSLLAWIALVTIAIPGVLLASHAIFVIGKPVITISRDDFETPLIPQLPWEAVDGISLQTYRHRGMLVAQHLYFRSRALPAYRSRGTRAQRFFSRMRMGSRFTVTVELKDARERAEVVDRLARSLWKQKTGWDYQWYPGMSDQLIDVLQKSDRIAKRMKSEIQNGEFINHDAVALEREVRRMDEVLKSESRRSRSNFWLYVWLQILVGGGLFAYLILLFFGVI